MRKFILLVFLVLSVLVPTSSHADVFLEEASKISSNTVVETRHATVRVEPITELGYGTGSYFRHKGYDFVLTAMHVMMGEKEAWVHSPSGEKVKAWLIYGDETKDFAILAIEELKTRKPMRLRSARNTRPGGQVVYSGFPGGHLRPQTYYGTISGWESHNRYLTQSFAWFGSSGACFFDNRGRLVGVLTSIDSKVFFVMQAIPTVVWVSPIDTELVKDLVELYYLIAEE